jgi:hypothetical protein
MHDLTVDVIGGNRPMAKPVWSLRIGALQVRVVEALRGVSYRASPGLASRHAQNAASNGISVPSALGTHLAGSTRATRLRVDVSGHCSQRSQRSLVYLAC